MFTKKYLDMYAYTQYMHPKYLDMHAPLE